MKIAKINKVVKLPKEKKTVRGALLRAMDDAKTEGWKKVVIFGIGDIQQGMRHTEETEITLLGMLEEAKAMIYRE